MPKGASLKVGDLVFVPGSNGFVDAKGLLEVLPVT